MIGLQMFDRFITFAYRCSQVFLLVIGIRTLILAGSNAQRPRCRFPSDWKGHYFQSGLGPVVIRDTSVTQKGNCVDQHKDYFLFSNRDNRCVQCLLMIRRHENIIQYKESYCISPDTLRKVCQQIRVETTLHTLVRDPATPTTCPFNDAYYFNYNDHLQGSSCDQPISYAKPCVARTKYQLHFKQCSVQSHIPVVDSGKDVDLECLATWKDGSESYLYARQTSSTTPTTKDEQYRCLKYQFVGTEVLVAMSADATCRGLRTATDGPYIMVLRKDEFGWPSPACQFPSWFLDIAWWKDTESKHAYNCDVTGRLLTSSKLSSARRQHQPIGENSCSLAIDGDNKTKVEATFRTLSTHGCISKQQCIKFVLRAPGVVDLYQGTWMGNPLDHVTESGCVMKDDQRSALTLIPEEIIVSGCAGLIMNAVKTSTIPAMNNNSCVHTYRFAGCNNDTWRTTAESPICSQGPEVLECQRTWTSSDGFVYVVGKEMQVNSGVGVNTGMTPASLRQSNCAASTTASAGKDGSGHNRMPQADLSVLSLLTFIRLGNSNIYRSTSSTGNRQTSQSVTSSSGGSRQSADSRAQTSLVPNPSAQRPPDGRRRHSSPAGNGGDGSARSSDVVEYAHYDDVENNYEVDGRNVNDDNEDGEYGDDDDMPASGDVMLPVDPTITSNRQDGAGDRQLSFPAGGRKGGVVATRRPPLQQQRNVAKQHVSIYDDESESDDVVRGNRYPVVDAADDVVRRTLSTSTAVAPIVSTGSTTSAVLKSTIVLPKTNPTPPLARRTPASVQSSRQSGSGNGRSTTTHAPTFRTLGQHRKPSSSSSTSSASRRHPQSTSGSSSTVAILRWRTELTLLIVYFVLPLLPILQPRICSIGR